MGAIAIGDKLPLKLFTQIMDSDNYLNIIKGNYKDMESLVLKGWVLQFDNDPNIRALKRRTIRK